MVRKPNRMYKKIEGQSYTRKEYMGGVPAIRIAQFSVGTQNANYPVVLSLHIDEACQVRDIALEAARIAATKYLSSKAGTNFFMQIRTFPHFVLREHKLATGAGADRVSSGMRAAFGKPVGSAVRTKRGQKLITVSTTREFFPEAKEALRRASRKLPSPCRIIVEKE